ncbi:hypothetical protein D3C76_729780 [compost metagenome]
MTKACTFALILWIWPQYSAQVLKSEMENFMPSRKTITIFVLTVMSDYRGYHFTGENEGDPEHGGDLLERFNSLVLLKSTCSVIQILA